MQTKAGGQESAPLMRSMLWVAAASFIAGFGGYLVFGLNSLG